MVNIGNEWDSLLAEQFKSDYYLKLREFLVQEYSQFNIYPPMENIFNSLKLVDYKDVKCVIIGQDPYHGKGQAHGLSFSVQDGVRIPPSLMNIFKEIENDLLIPPPKSGNLTGWAKQGVLLLNAVLTVREGKPNSHKGKGWEQLTDSVISKLNERETPIVFMLWGANAKSKASLVTNPKHLVLQAAHPSPLSAFNGFFGCKHFSQANNFLMRNGLEPINWQL